MNEVTISIERLKELEAMEAENIKLKAKLKSIKNTEFATKKKK